MADERKPGRLRQSWAILIVGMLGLVTTFATYWVEKLWTKKSERAALTSEAAYLCRAMSWQLFYLGSNEDPTKWPDLAGRNKLEYLGIEESSLVRAWSRPSWFPFRTPAWNVLKDKVGDLNEKDARDLTHFFSRVQFLNVLHRRRHCYLNGSEQFWLIYREQFWLIYVRGLRNQLADCRDSDWGLETKEKEAFEHIVDEVDIRLNKIDWPKSQSAAPTPPCDTDNSVTQSGSDPAVEGASE